MATIATPVHGDLRIVLHDVPWQAYASLLNARGEGSIRLTYHHGVLEIMTLSWLHERLSEILGGFITGFARFPAKSSRQTASQPERVRRFRKRREIITLADYRKGKVLTALEVTITDRKITRQKNAGKEAALAGQARIEIE